MTTARDYLFGYDIADDRRRRRALKILRSECFGYQDSVFELNLNKGHAEQLVERLLPYIDPETDKLFYVRLMKYPEPYPWGGWTNSSVCTVCI